MPAVPSTAGGAPLPRPVHSTIQRGGTAAIRSTATPEGFACQDRSTGVQSDHLSASAWRHRDGDRRTDAALLGAPSIGGLPAEFAPLRTLDARSNDLPRPVCQQPVRFGRMAPPWQRS
jgi:hypothetical protein